MDEIKGMVYVLTNPAMPGIVKIGLTTRETMEERLKELFKTNIPVPFKCEFACRVDDSKKVENALHIAFQPYRFPQREFFKIEAEQAISILKLFEKAEITSEFNKEINNITTKEERDAGEKLEKLRKPPLNFLEMGIPVGSHLKFTEDGTEVEIVEEKKVKYLDELYSLSNLTKKLLNLDYYVRPNRYWTYKGKNIQEQYDVTYKE